MVIWWPSWITTKIAGSVMVVSWGLPVTAFFCFFSPQKTKIWKCWFLEVNWNQLILHLLLWKGFLYTLQTILYGLISNIIPEASDSQGLLIKRGCQTAGLQAGCVTQKSHPPELWQGEKNCDTLRHVMWCGTFETPVIKECYSAKSKRQVFLRKKMLWLTHNNVNGWHSAKALLLWHLRQIFKKCLITAGVEVVTAFLVRLKDSR